jgi:hypothetical protein
LEAGAPDHGAARRLSTPRRAAAPHKAVQKTMRQTIQESAGQARRVGIESLDVLPKGAVIEAQATGDRQQAKSVELAASTTCG